MWKSGPWDLPSPAQAKTPAVVEPLTTPVSSQQRPIPTETIVSKNLFDPERGASLTREAEANSRAVQRIRSMVLLGTAVIGNNRLAILQDSETAPAARTAAPPSGLMRIKQGDTVEGFTLSEIADKKVVFTKGPARIELALDYFRKTESRPTGSPPPAQVRPAAPGAPRVLPNLPRRPRAPGEGGAG